MVNEYLDLLPQALNALDLLEGFETTGNDGCICPVFALNALDLLEGFETVCLAKVCPAKVPECLRPVRRF